MSPLLKDRIFHENIFMLVYRPIAYILHNIIYRMYILFHNQWVRWLYAGASRVFRMFYAPKVHCSEGSLFRSFVVPKVRWSEGSLVRIVGLYVSFMHVCCRFYILSDRHKVNICVKPSVTLHRQVKRIGLEPAHVSFCRAHIDKYRKSSDF